MTVFTTARPVLLSWARWIPIYLIFILKLSFHLRLNFPSSLITSGFHTKAMYVCTYFSSFPFVPHSPPISSSFVWSQEWIWAKCKSHDSPLCSFLQSPVISYLLGPNISLSPQFSNNLGLCSSLNSRDQVSHLHQTGGKRIFCIYFVSEQFA